MCKGDNPKSFNLNSSNFGSFIQVFGLRHILLFGVCLQHLKRKIKILFFSRKIVTSLAYIFTLENTWSRSFLSVKNLFMNRL